MLKFQLWQNSGFGTSLTMITTLSLCIKCFSCMIRVILVAVLFSVLSGVITVGKQHKVRICHKVLLLRAQQKSF